MKKLSQADFLKNLKKQESEIIDGKKNGVQSHPGSGQGRFDTGVAGTDDSNIAGSCVIGGHTSSSEDFFSTGGRTKGLHTTSQRLMGVPRAWNFSS